MLRKLSVFIGLAGLLVLSASPASANLLSSDSATANCQGYSLTVNAYDLKCGPRSSDFVSRTCVECGTETPIDRPVDGFVE
jgi:hypothetical protein